MFCFVSDLINMCTAIFLREVGRLSKLIFTRMREQHRPSGSWFEEIIESVEPKVTFIEFKLVSLKIPGTEGPG